MVQWLLDLLLNEMKLKNLTRKYLKPFKAGSAFEKVQAGEATDFDVMIFLDISKGIWKVGVVVIYIYIVTLGTFLCSCRL